MELAYECSPERLSAFFVRDDVMVFVGGSIRNVISKFNSDFSFMLGKTTVIKNAIDIGTMAIHRGVVKRAKGESGLDSLCERTLKKRLPKPSHIGFSDAWDNRGELHSEAQNYAIRDAWVLIHLYKAYKDLPDLTVRMSPEAVKVNVVVNIMPSIGTAVSSQAN